MDLKEMLNTDSPGLIRIIDFWKDYDAKTVLLAYAELKKRDYFIPERLLNKTFEFAEKNNFSNIDEFLKSKMTETEFYSFNEYLNKKKITDNKINSDKIESNAKSMNSEIISDSTGYILGFSSAFIYTLVVNPYYGIDGFIIFYSGSITIPLIITFLIYFASKEIKFGKVFGITCVIILLLAGLGNTQLDNL